MIPQRIMQIISVIMAQKVFQTAPKNQTVRRIGDNEDSSSDNDYKGVCFVV